MKGKLGRRSKPRTPAKPPKRKAPGSRAKLRAVAKVRKRAKPRAVAKVRKPAKPRPVAKTRKPAKPRPQQAARAPAWRQSSPAAMRPALTAENDLLDLARSLADAARAHASDGKAMEVALLRLEAAFAGGGALPRRYFRSWLRTWSDKTATLALAWAREQVRRGVGEVLERERSQGRVRSDVSPETLSWLVLAASEAMAHEPLGASRDRIAMLLEFLRPPGGS